MTPARVVLVAFDGLQALDLTGPHEVFAAASAWAQAQGMPRPYELTVATTRPGVLRSDTGLGFHVPDPLPAGPVDTVLVVGGTGSRTVQDDAELLAWIRAAAARARRTCSVCTGAFVLAGAGLLDGRRVTTHWAAARELADRYPAVEVDPEPLFLRDGALWSSAGVTAGTDLALALVEDDLGPVAAQAVARELVLFHRRTGGQSQFAGEVWTDPPDRAALRDLVRHIHAEPGADLRLPVLAERAAMSVRHLQRVFAEEVGGTPSAYVTRARVEAARRRLELRPDTVAQVARDCGFGTAESMRRAFHRCLGVAPDVYRDRFHHQESR